MQLKDILAKLETKSAFEGTESSIPENLQANVAQNEPPKNLVQEGQAGDQEKIDALLQAITEKEEVKASAENMIGAKMAEEVAALDQAIMHKQAQYFGVEMADAFINRISQHGDFTGSKQASEVSSEDKYKEGFDFGVAMYDGMKAKSAEDVSGGIMDQGAMPANFNQDQVDALSEDLTNYLLQAEEGEKESSEFYKIAGGNPGRIAKMYADIKKHLGANKLKYLLPTIGVGAAGAGIYGNQLAGKYGYGAPVAFSDKQSSELEKLACELSAIVLSGFEDGLEKKAAEVKVAYDFTGKIKKFYEMIKKVPGQVKGNVQDAYTLAKGLPGATVPLIGAGLAVGAGSVYAADRMRGNNKKSSEKSAEDVVNAYLNKVISKDEAADKLIALRND